jgi:hypothetical protein
MTFACFQECAVIDKTTITERLLTHSWTDNATYINPDIIAQEQFGGWNNKEAVLRLAISASLPTPLNNLSNSRIDFSFLSNTCFFIAVHPLIDLPVCLIAYKTSIL